MRIVALLLPLLLAASAGGATITLDFEEEAPGLYEPGFVSTECNCVELLEHPGTTGVLEIDDFFLGSRALIVGEEGGALLLEFLVPVFGIQLDFWTHFGIPNVELADARLQAFAGDELVADVSVTPDPQGPQVFQTIAVTSDVAITRAIFTKPDQDEFEPASPVVDNLVLTVPEPRAIAFGAISLAAIGAARATRSRPR
jgi:hypothetical protein